MPSFSEAASASLLLHDVAELELVLGAPLRRDVQHHSRQQRRAPGVVHDRRLVAEPHDPPVSATSRYSESSGSPVALLRSSAASAWSRSSGCRRSNHSLRVRHPLLDRVAEDLLDLRGSRRASARATRTRTCKRSPAGARAGRGIRTPPSAQLAAGAATRAAVPRSHHRRKAAAGERSARRVRTTARGCRATDPPSHERDSDRTRASRSRSPARAISSLHVVLRQPGKRSQRPRRAH